MRIPLPFLFLTGLSGKLQLQVQLPGEVSVTLFAARRRKRAGRDGVEGGKGKEIVLQVVGRRSPCCLNRLNSEHMCACNFTRRRCEAFRIRTRIHIRIRIPHTHTERERVSDRGGQALWLCSECQRLHITATLIRSARHLSR